jgi:thymidine phosphorylase
MLPAEVIGKKRDGEVLTPEDLSFIAKGLSDGNLSDAQAGAFAMAVFLKGFTVEERVGLTEAMRDSGDVLTWDLPGPVVDKHSTGGVGDTVSLIAAPVLAACGAYVPMISGRGLGHTGGTLDKFDAIPGYRTQPDIETFQRVTRDAGCAIIGQTKDIAPADKRLYAIRDVTGTVATSDLIAPSILSKKLAAGLDFLISDVKVGSGAFMTDIGHARDLAHALVDVANGAGCKSAALITDMNQPLSGTVGNALEVANAVAILKGAAKDPRLEEVTYIQCADLVQLCGLAETRAEGLTMVMDAMTSGRAAERFAKMVAALGGPADFMEKTASHLAQTEFIGEVFAEDQGAVNRIDTSDLGLALIGLGGGRKRESDSIDVAVGFQDMAALGETVDGSRPLARIHASSEEALEQAKAAVQAAYHIGDAPKNIPLIYERIG